MQERCTTKLFSKPPNKRVAEVAVIFSKETLIQAGKAYLCKFPIEVEVTIGETMAEKSNKKQVSAS